MPSCALRYCTLLYSAVWYSLVLRCGEQVMFDKNWDKVKPLRVIGAIVVMFLLSRRTLGYWHHSQRMAEMLSNPSIILKVRPLAAQPAQG